MAFRFWNTQNDNPGVRQTIVPLLKPDDAVFWLPDRLIESAPFAGRAELTVLTRVGTDWPLIEAGTAPAAYGGGYPDLARSLLHGAAQLYVCVFLCPLMRQIVAKSEKQELADFVRDISWSNMAQEYLSLAQQTLESLVPQTVFVPGMTLARRAYSPIDPLAEQVGRFPGFAPMFPTVDQDDVDEVVG